MYQIAKNLLLLMVISSVCFAGMEVISIKVWGRRYPAVVEYHPRRVYTHKPLASGSYEIPRKNEPPLYIPYTYSSIGLKDREYEKKKEDEFRIIILGDSFTEGSTQDSDHTICRQLEDRLNQLYPERRVTVINMGTSGYGPWQERDQLNEIGFSLEPDLILFQVFLGNDIDNTLAKQGKFALAYNTKWREIYLDISQMGTTLGAVDSWMSHHSQLYYQLKEMIWPTRIKSPISEKRTPGMEVNLKEWYPLLDEGWDNMQEDMRGIKHDCEDHHVPIMIFNVPLLDILRVDKIPAIYDPEKDQRLIKEFALHEGIPYIDVASPLRAQKDLFSMYYQMEGHLTSQGAHVVAMTIANALIHNNQFLRCMSTQREHV